MSQSKNLHQAERWRQTAAEDLRAARTLADSGICARACFLAQQSGEKALEAIWYAVDADPWGHSLQRLLKELPAGATLSNVDDLVESAGLLDQFYIPTRYPNGLPDLTPGQVYQTADARRGIQAAEIILAACRV